MGTPLLLHLAKWPSTLSPSHLPTHILTDQCRVLLSTIVELARVHEEQRSRTKCLSWWGWNNRPLNWQSNTLTTPQSFVLNNFRLSLCGRVISYYSTEGARSLKGLVPRRLLLSSIYQSL